MIMLKEGLEDQRTKKEGLVLQLLFFVRLITANSRCLGDLLLRPLFCYHRPLG